MNPRVNRGLMIPNPLKQHGGLPWIQGLPGFCKNAGAIGRICCSPSEVGGPCVIREDDRPQNLTIRVEKHAAIAAGADTDRIDLRRI